MTRRRLALLAVVAVAVVVVLQLAVGTWTVTSGSMAPALRTGDRVWAERVSARVGGVDRGDVVVFRDPGGWAEAARLAAGGTTPAPAATTLVKRVVAVGGDRVACCDRGRLLLNGRPLAEPYLPAGRPASSLGFDRVVPQGSLFVLGDDREGSLDSRSLTATEGRGFVPLDDVLGVVLRP